MSKTGTSKIIKEHFSAASRPVIPDFVLRQPDPLTTHNPSSTAPSEPQSVPLVRIPRHPLNRHCTRGKRRPVISAIPGPIISRCPRITSSIRTNNLRGPFSPVAPIPGASVPLFKHHQIFQSKYRRPWNLCVLRPKFWRVLEEGPVRVLPGRERVLGTAQPQPHRASLVLCVERAAAVRRLDVAIGAVKPGHPSAGQLQRTSPGC